MDPAASSMLEPRGPPIIDEKGFLLPDSLWRGLAGWRTPVERCVACQVSTVEKMGDSSGDVLKASKVEPEDSYDFSSIERRGSSRTMECYKS